jgi:biopolymer transport protein ExbD
MRIRTFNPAIIVIFVVYFAEPPKYCGDGRTVVVTVLKSGAIRMNAESLRLDEFGKRLEEVFRTWYTRLIFVKADPDVPLQQVVQIIDIAKMEHI